MYLHNDYELFKEVVYSTAVTFQQPVPIIEKDYYVTMLLKELSVKAPNCIFKGGTSLSKCFNVIDRFSEDIDITFNSILNQSQRKNLKNKTIAEISTCLNLPIVNWSETRSRRDYNCYIFQYKPLTGLIPQNLVEGVKLEIVLGSVPFPTVKKTVDSYVYKFLSIDNIDIVTDYALHPFTMEVQTLERTLIDKVFALCDYYLQNKIHRHSRHIYDIHMLFPHVELNDTFKNLIHEVRLQRASMKICPSAQENVNVTNLLKEIITTNAYKNDYTTITTYFQNTPIAYDEALKSLTNIADSEIFDEAVTFNF